MASSVADRRDDASSASSSLSADVNETFHGLVESGVDEGMAIEAIMSSAAHKRKRKERHGRQLSRSGDPAYMEAGNTFRFREAEEEVGPEDVSYWDLRQPALLAKFNQLEEEEEACEDDGAPRSGPFLASVNLDVRDRERAARPFTSYSPDGLAARPPLENPDALRRDQSAFGWEGLQHTRPDAIRIFVFCNLALPSSHVPALAKALHPLPHLTHLIMCNVGLTSLDLFRLPTLRLVMLDDNFISSSAQLTRFADRSPNIEVLSMRNNPVCHGKSAEKLWQKIVAKLYHLRSFNGALVSPQEKVEAIRMFGSKKAAARLPYVLWDMSMCTHPAVVQAVHGFGRLNALTALDLRGAGLTAFHVGKLIHLERLVLRENRIRSLANCGLEQLTNLRALDLQGNEIKSKSELEVLQWLDNLQRLGLRGNPLSERYRQRAIVVCRDLRGTNRLPGLQVLDGEPITVDEHINALALSDKVTAREAEIRRWHIQCIDYFGHWQLSDVAFRQAIHHLILHAVNLQFADVAHLPNLEYLNLADNKLTLVIGLEHCKSMRYLYLGGNPQLDVTRTIDQVTALTALVDVSLVGRAGLRADIKDHDAHRHRVLAAVLPTHNYLAYLDGERVTVRERVAAFAARGMRGADLETYRTQLALAVNATGARGRMYDPASVPVGRQYAPETVTRLVRMADIGLTNSPHLVLDAFRALRELNLRGNDLESILALRLDACPNLCIVDVSRNSICDSLNAIAELVDSLPQLETLAIRENPCIDRIDNGRIRLLGAMMCMRELNCHLRVLDTVLTMSERVQAWQVSWLSVEDAEKRRTEATLAWRTPRDVPIDQVDALELSNMELVHLDLRLYTGLVVLDLRANKIDSLLPIGLDNVPHLELLDVRENALTSLEDAMLVVDHLKALVALALADNPFRDVASPAEYRLRVLQRLPRLRYDDSQFYVLDDDDVTVDEILAAHPTTEAGDATALAKFRFNVYLRRQLQETADEGEEEIDMAHVTQLDLSNIGLTICPLSSFRGLTHLALQGNKLRSEALRVGLSGLECLEALDVRQNSCKSLTRFALVIDSFRSLRVLLCDRNPMMPVDTPESRKRLLGKLQCMADAECTLEKLNGKQLEMDERIDALRNVSTSETESFRVRFLVWRGKVPWTAKRIQIENRGLRMLTPQMAAFVNLRFLDVSNNHIEEIAPDALRTLKHMETFKIRHNNLNSLQDLLEALAPCNGLRFLYIFKASATGSTDKPKRFVKRACSHLPGLTQCDGFRNPFPLSAEQQSAVRYLHGLAGVGPNDIVHLNLANQNIGKDDFEHVLRALRLLRPQKLWLHDNPVTEVFNYRFLLIFSAKGVKELDGSHISTDERANAERIVYKMLEAGGDTSKSDWMTKVSVTRTAQVGAAAAFAAAHHEDMFSTLSAMASNTSKKESMKAPGSVLTKLEIIINYIQLFGLLLTFELPYPDRWIDLVFWIPTFNLDIDVLVSLNIPAYQYVKFGVFMAMPLVLGFLYRVKLNEENWRRRFLERWSRTKVLTSLLLLLYIVACAAASILLTYSTDFDRVRSGKFTENRATVVLFAILLSPALVYFVFFIWAALAYRRKHNRPYFFWSSFEKRKKRVALFFMTILYLPITRVALLNFQCDPDTNTMRTFPDRTCPETVFLDWHPIMWASLFFGVLYTLGTPFFFYRLVRKGFAEIDRHYDITTSAAKLKAKRAEYKSAKGKMDKETRKDERDKLQKDDEALYYLYAEAVGQYRTASSYLYQAYEYRMRYWKVIQMVEKTILLSVSIFIATSDIVWLQSTIAAGVVILFTTVQWIMRPMNDHFEDFMDLGSRTANSSNIGLGVAALNKWLPLGIILFLLVGINSVNILSYMLLALIGPFRNRRRLKKSKMEALRREREEHEREARRAAVVATKSDISARLDAAKGKAKYELDFDPGQGFIAKPGKSLRVLSSSADRWNDDSDLSNEDMVREHESDSDAGAADAGGADDKAADEHVDEDEEDDGRWGTRTASRSSRTSMGVRFDNGSGSQASQRVSLVGPTGRRSSVAGRRSSAAVGDGSDAQAAAAAATASMRLARSNSVTASGTEIEMQEIDLVVPSRS